MEIKMFVDLAIVMGLIGVIWGTVNLVVYFKKHKANTELWATVFEGLTHKLADLTPLKVPESYIEKKAKRDGLDKDAVKAEEGDKG